MALDLSTLTDREALTAIYIGYYERAADPAGMNFWEDVVENTSLDLVAISTDFSTQVETRAVHPYFDNPAANDSGTFITSLYQNLFNREPDAAGLQFWSDQLDAAVAGEEGAFSVGEIITKIIEGAQDIEGGTQDRTTILNKIAVGVDWTNAAEAAGINYSTNEAAQESARSILDGVTDDPETVADAKETTDDFFGDAGEPGEPSIPGQEFFLTSSTDVMNGTDGDDDFLAYIQQNPFLGGVSNSLSSADRLDGGAGFDKLYAELSVEFIGTEADDELDVQPRLKNIEKIEIEAREGESYYDNVDQEEDAFEVIIDGKHITDHVEFGSYFSDGDLKFENMTTLTANGTARNTSDLTVTMDHTDNFNTDKDASDLMVLFDNDYLLSGQTSVGTADFFLLDQDAELRIQRGQSAEGRLDEIDKNGIRFEMNGKVFVVDFDGALVAEGNPAEVNTHAQFVAALQDSLNAQIADGTLPAGTKIELFNFSNVVFDSDGLALNRAGLQDGSFSDLIPSIRVISGDGSEVKPLGFTAPDEVTGEFNVFGRFDNSFEESDEPIAINIELDKVGRGGEGGDLIIGAKSTHTNDDIIANGIEVFNVAVKGAGDKPSNVGTITSTGSELRVINIVTAPEFVNGDTFASLTVRNGFDQNTNGDQENGDLELINADGFLGDLTLGDITANQNAGRITNADTITAQGGGDVTLGLRLDGTEPLNDGIAPGQAYTVTTGGGDDIIDIVLDGDGLDYAGDSLKITTGDGNDKVFVDGNNIGNDFDTNNQRLNQAILDNVEINTGAGDDIIRTNINSKGNLNINAGSGNDFVDTSGGRFQGWDDNDTYASWVFNHDDTRMTTPDDVDVPGVPTSLAYVGGATVTVILSGAGIALPHGAGGGVMEAELANIAAGVSSGAVNGINGYEASATIGSLINGNKHYGDQRDVNAAVLAAIENDPVLSKLIDVQLTENNTWVARMTTGGEFHALDLRVEIDQKDAATTAHANSVLAEARTVFNDSGLVSTDLFAAVPGGAYLDAGPGADLQTTLGTDAWYTGLSAAGDDLNAAGVTQIDNGNASLVETDNVINPGDGDDLVVLSTDGRVFNVNDYTPIAGNTLQNQASNETIVLEGQNFGNDTIMNFTTAGEPVATVVDTVEFDIRDSVTVVYPTTPGGVSVAIITGVADDPVEVTLTDGINSAQIAAEVANAINNASGADFNATVTGDVITLTGVDGNAVGSGVVFTVEDRDDTGTIATYTATQLGEGGTGLVTGVATVPVFTIEAGVDFLDFSDYLTSQFDSSTGSGPDSSDSNILSPVLLDYNEINTLGGGVGSGSGNVLVEQNEVAVVRFTEDTADNETFAGLSASVVQQLFNDTLADADNNFGNLAESALNVETYQKTDTEELVGNAKAIFMVENGANLGEYKVFELTWSGDQTAPNGDSVSAVEIGSLDFGTSLTGMNDVNLVGSQDYADLIENGFTV